MSCYNVTCQAAVPLAYPSLCYVAVSVTGKLLKLVCRKKFINCADELVVINGLCKRRSVWKLLRLYVVILRSAAGTRGYVCCIYSVSSSYFITTVI